MFQTCESTLSTSSSNCKTEVSKAKTQCIEAVDRVVPPDEVFDALERFEEWYNSTFGRKKRSTNHSSLWQEAIADILRQEFDITLPQNGVMELIMENLSITQ